jgi:hypothetical protein
MIITCINCKNPIPLTLNNVPKYYDSRKELICPNCKNETRITTHNVVSFTYGDGERLGILWRFSCKNCDKIIEPIPYRFNLNSKFEDAVCPICKNANIVGEHVPDYLGGVNNIGLSKNEIVAKNYFYFIKTLLDVCCKAQEYFQESDLLIIDKLIEIIITKVLTNGEVDLKKVIKNWKHLAEGYEKLQFKFIELQVAGISKNQIETNIKKWQDLKNDMTNLESKSKFKTIIRWLFRENG